ncbi:hypothetical protein SFUMM280S_08636 [Streptomyces fumanus]
MYPSLADDDLQGVRPEEAALWGGDVPTWPSKPDPDGEPLDGLTFD